MTSFSTKIILEDTFYEEFSTLLKDLETAFGMNRKSETRTPGNSFGMKGNTYIIEYAKGGRKSGFRKALHILWAGFNKKHPGTAWKGK